MQPLTARSLSLVVVAVTALFLTTGPATPIRANQPKDNDPVKALQKERLVILQKIYDTSLQTFKAGQLPFDQVLSAQLALLNGKLDLCETKAERVKVHEEMVKVAEQMVEAVRKLVEARNATALDALKAEAQLLDARIGLEKAKAAK